MNTKQDTKEKWVEQYLFSKKEMDEMIHWHPVSNIPVEEIYKDLPEVKQFHENYCRFWLKKTLDR